MASIYCPQCGTPNDSPSTFCGNCGYTLQATDAATSRSAQGQQNSTQLPPPPPPYAGGNVPSSANYPAGGTPPSYPIGNTPSSPTYPAAGTPPPPYPIGHTPSAPTYPAGGTPSPSYPVGSAASFPTHPAGGTPSSANFPAGVTPPPPVYYPKGEANVPPQKPQQHRKGKGGIIAILIIVLIVILAGGGAGAYIYLSHNASSNKPTGSTSTPGVTATTAPTQAATATTAPTQSTTATAEPTTTASSSTPGTTPTTSGSPLNSYSATQPGPGCDTGGGTWTPQGFSNITCGTQVTVGSNSSRGYLYLQLPNNQAFAADNTIGITGKVNGNYGANCVGLAEIGSNAGYLVEYCSDGGWHIYSISSTGAVVKTLSQNITSTRSTEQLSLSLKGATLAFTIDSETHSISVSPLQPTKVAVTFFGAAGGNGVTITNFSYITPSS